MANRGRIIWTAELKLRLKELLILGIPVTDVLPLLNQEFPEAKLTHDALLSAQKRYGLSAYLVCQQIESPKYFEGTLADDNYMVSCDYHAPYFSETWVNRLLGVAEKFKIKKHIIAGDLFDFDFAKAHNLCEGEERSSIDKEAQLCSPLISALNYFDEIFLICGNHETRLGRITDARVQSRHILENFGREVWKNKFQFSVFDKIQLGQNWLITHPKSYSQVSGSVAVRLAEKYNRNILNAHGHFVALRYDRSGKYMAIDLGGMFDQRKVAYVSLITTTHPFWNQGFCAFFKDHVYHFHNGTDWQYWGLA